MANNTRSLFFNSPRARRQVGSAGLPRLHESTPDLRIAEAGPARHRSEYPDQQSQRSHPPPSPSCGGKGSRPPATTSTMLAESLGGFRKLAPQAATKMSSPRPGGRPCRPQRMEVNGLVCMARSRGRVVYRHVEVDAARKSASCIQPGPRVPPVPSQHQDRGAPWRPFPSIRIWRWRNISTTIALSARQASGVHRPRQHPDASAGPTWV